MAVEAARGRRARRRSPTACARCPRAPGSGRPGRVRRRGPRPPTRTGASGARPRAARGGRRCRRPGRAPRRPRRSPARRTRRRRSGRAPRPLRQPGCERRPLLPVDEARHRVEPEVLVLAVEPEGHARGGRLLGERFAQGGQVEPRERAEQLPVVGAGSAARADRLVEAPASSCRTSCTPTSRAPRLRWDWTAVERWAPPGPRPRVQPAASINSRRRRVQPPWTSTVTSNDGTDDRVRDDRQGPPLILVDGALCYRDCGPSRPLAEQLAADFTVITYDRRGRGESGDGEAVRRRARGRGPRGADRGRRRIGPRVRHLLRRALALEAARNGRDDRQARPVRAAVHRRRQPTSG